MIFYLFFITLSSANGFPSPDIKIEPEDSMDIIQGELKEQKTVFTMMMSNIKDEMTEMKKCLLKREENIAESISACTAALEQSIQEAVDWVITLKEEPAGINDPGESQKCKDFICLIIIAFLFVLD